MDSTGPVPHVTVSIPLEPMQGKYMLPAAACAISTLVQIQKMFSRGGFNLWETLSQETIALHINGGVDAIDSSAIAARLEERFLETIAALEDNATKAMPRIARDATKDREALRVLELLVNARREVPSLELIVETTSSRWVFPQVSAALLIKSVNTPRETLEFFCTAVKSVSPPDHQGVQQIYLATGHVVRAGLTTEQRRMAVEPGGIAISGAATLAADQKTYTLQPGFAVLCPDRS